MAVGVDRDLNDMAASNPQPIAQPSHRGAPVANNAQAAVSPPSKQALQSWWKKFSRKPEKDEERVNAPAGIFGVPLAESIRYANVAISLTNEQGESFIYGYVPIVVAKCGVFLKEKATDVEGIYRLNGSAKRIKDLQTIFNTPDRYGKGLDWTGYTVHDAANVLRRYLNQLPEPIVPLEFYERFRDPLRAYQAQGGEPAESSAMENAEHTKAVTAYQKLITELPPLNRQLLLYLLDLLAVFASKSDLNRMTAQNLAAIFQPGIISHPSHDMAPQEYRLSQDVLIFLIENQDNFLIGMTGTGIDDKTRDEVASGVSANKTPKSTIGRSASNASAGADSLRRLRRNVSVGSRGSRNRASPEVSAPGTPSSPSAGGAALNTSGLSRSNTVPSKRSPALTGQRYHRSGEPSQPTTPIAQVPSIIPASPPDNQPEPHPASAPVVLGTDATDGQAPRQITNDNQTSTRVDRFYVNEPLEATAADSNLNVEDNKTVNRERKISNLLTGKSPIFGASDGPAGPQRQPRKLQKRRLPGSANESAQSSQASLQADEMNSFHTPMLTPNPATLDQANPMEQPTSAVAMAGIAQDGVREPHTSTPPSARAQWAQQQTLKIPQSPTLSLHSRGSATDPSDLDALDDPAAKEERKTRRRFRLSSARADDSALQPPPPIGQNNAAGTSNSSFGSSRPRKSFTGDSQATQNVDSAIGSQPSVGAMSSRESTDLLKDSQQEPEKKGLFGKWKARIRESKDEKREREAEKERAKSPPRFHNEQSGSRNSLSAFAHEHLVPRGRSFDQNRSEALPVVTEAGAAAQQQRRPQSMQPAQAIVMPPGYPSVSAQPFNTAHPSTAAAPRQPPPAVSSAGPAPQQSNAAYPAAMAASQQFNTAIQTAAPPQLNTAVPTATVTQVPETPAQTATVVQVPNTASAAVIQISDTTAPPPPQSAAQSPATTQIPPPPIQTQTQTVPPPTSAVSAPVTSDTDTIIARPPAREQTQ